MKRKKTITPAVTKANSANAKRSTGPKTDEGKDQSKMNALKHGLTTRQMHFASDEEEREFMVLRDRVRAERQPRGIEEEILVEEIASTSHKLRITLSMETKELVQLQKCDSNQVHKLFTSKPILPIDSWQLPLFGGWACERLLVRAASGKGNEGTTGESTPRVGRQPSGAMLRLSQDESRTGNSDETRLEINAVLENALSRVTRYQRGLKSDLYRAIEMLNTLQARREKKDV